MDKKIIAVYPGRFQPLHKGHKQVYDWLKQKFGNAVIATSDKVEQPKSPFNFSEKVQIMSLAGVPSSDIQQVRNPYIASEVLRKYDGKNTVLVFAVSQKDMEEDPRFSFRSTKSGSPSYLQPFPKNGKNLKPFGDPDKPIGYVIVTPTFGFDVLGKPMRSATEVRKQFSEADYDTQAKIIQDLFGNYSKKVHNLMNKRIVGSSGKPKSISDIRAKGRLKEEHLDNVGELDHEKFGPMLDTFVQFASKKLGIKSLPTKELSKDDMKTSFAAYNPGKKHLMVVTKNRHPMDIFRSVAHELVHHKQNEDGRLGKDIEKEGATGSDIENEANSEAGKIMRWFAKSNPSMFKSGYVVEEASIYKKTATKNPKTGDIYAFGRERKLDGKPIEDGGYVVWILKSNYDGKVRGGIRKTWRYIKKDLSYNDAVKLMNRRVGHIAYNEKDLKEETLQEGLYDTGIFKAVFLAGGPGSGKDWVLDRVLGGQGLVEINSDAALEHLMIMRNLDLTMPPEEEHQRNIVRGRAKNLTKEKERLALIGRLGVIINGTADDATKIINIKNRLEELGYDCKMLFVNTRDEVSKERNLERGKLGGRTVPEKIRSEKWRAVQAAKNDLERVFGRDDFYEIDNSEDYRRMNMSQKRETDMQHTRLFKQFRQFVSSSPRSQIAKNWVEQERRRRNIIGEAKEKATEQPKYVPNASELEQAKRLGVAHLGNGVFGAGKDQVSHISNKGQLTIAVPVLEEIRKKIKACWKGYEAIGFKNKNGKRVPNCVPVSESNHNKPADREWGKPSLTKIYAEGTPGQISKKKVDENGSPTTSYSNGSNHIGATFGSGNGTGGYGMGYSIPINESVYKWMTNEKTIDRFVQKYGDLAEERLVHVAIQLSEMETGIEMGTVPKQGSKEEHPLPEDWQKVNRRDKTDGLSQKAVNAYRRENPGSKLQTAVTEKNPTGKRAERRLSFCRRMSGMKKRLTSAETARDPDSRINKALRRWNCEE